VDVDQVTIYRWVQRFTPEFMEAARPRRHVPGDRWFVDETYVKVNGPVDVPVPGGRPGRAGHRRLAVCQARSAPRAFFTRALATGAVPVEVTTDRAPAYPRALDELIPTAVHDTEQYANNTIEADHGRLKARLRPMRGLKAFRSARVHATGHAFVQNIRRGHYEITTDGPA